MKSTEQRGRPLKFESVEDLEIRINQYFDDCDKLEDTRVWSHDEIITEKDQKLCTNCWKGERTRGCLLVSGRLKLPRPYTITGLAVWLDTSRQTLLNYEIRPEFFDTLKRAKQRIEAFADESLYDKDKPTAGVKFSLSNNFDGWTEKREDTLKVQKDSAALLASRVFDDEEGEEETSEDEAPQDSSDTLASKPEGLPAAKQPEGVQENQ